MHFVLLYVGVKWVLVLSVVMEGVGVRWYYDINDTITDIRTRAGNGKYNAFF